MNLEDPKVAIMNTAPDILKEEFKSNFLVKGECRGTISQTILTVAHDLAVLNPRHLVVCVSTVEENWMMKEYVDIVMISWGIIGSYT